MVKPHPVNLLSEFAELFKKFEKRQRNDVLVLTPNKRLSRFLHNEYNQFQAANQTKKAWPSLNCHSVQGWTQNVWQKLALTAQHPLLLRVPMSPIQERILWQRVVEQHPDTPPLLSSKATAALAMDAWRLLQQWQLDVPVQSDSNVAIFSAWCDRFVLECEARGVVSSAQQLAVIQTCLIEQTLPAPGLVVLYGFDDLTPELKHLLDAMTAQGASIETLQWQRQPQQLQRHEFNDENAEIEAAALWARLQLQQQPQASIAVVVPKLAQLREKVERIFTRVFEPQYIFPQQLQHASGFNISAGLPMDTVPVVAAALNALACNGPWLEIEDVSRLLRSPFVGWKAEADEQALVDLELRELDVRVSLQQVMDALGKQMGETGEQYQRRCPQMFEAMGKFNEIRHTAPAKQLPSAWAQVFHRQLLALNWPGERTLDTLEYQQVQRWQEALQEMLTLDCVSGEMDWSAALQCLRALLKQISFQAQTKPSPIQILGVLEAAALPFDHLWLMNMDDETWPPMPNPNPLLPLPFQIEHAMPQSSSQRELEYARRLLQRFNVSAETVTYSHSTLQDDKHMRISPLLADVALQPFTLRADDSFADHLFRHQEIEASLDSCGPKIVDPSVVRGGTGILKDQSACPFQAFARHRLRTQEIPVPVMGLDAKDRGILVHKVMEIIWRRLRRHSKLMQMSSEQLDDLIQRSIDESMQLFQTQNSVGQRFLRIEAQRLAEQARAWLELEKQRQPFTVVFNEGKKTLKLGKLPLNIRYDRIDRLEDGSLFVLDYKTGKQQVRSWSGERPDEPQVPLYCVANASKVKGAAFGQIAADETAIKGIAEDEDIAPGLKAPDMLFKLDLPDQWPDIIQHWRTVLERLAHEFMAGAAEVDPKVPSVTCRYCELKSLCRIKEQFHVDDDEQSHEDNSATNAMLELAQID